MAEEKKPWEQDFETESNATNPWDQDFEVEDTSKKKDPTFVSPKKPSQESVSPYQDSGSKSVSPQPPSVSSSGYKFEPVKQPVQTSYSVTTQEKSGVKRPSTVDEVIKGKAVEVQNRVDNEYDRINYSIEKAIPIYEQNLKSKKDLEDQLNDPNTNPSAIPFLEKEYEKIISDIKNGDAILKNGFNSLKKLDNAKFIASQAEQVGKDLKLNKDTGAGGIFMRSAWNAFVPATVKGIGALVSLGGAVNAPSYSLDDDQKAELLSKAKEKYGEEKGVQLAEKFNKSLEGNQLFQTAGNFIVDFGNDLETEIPTKAQGSVLDGFTFDKAANIAGSGVGSMAAMLLPAGALGKAGKAAQLATAWGSSSLQTMGGVYDEARNAGLSDNEAAYLSLAIGLPVGAVDAVSGARFFGSKRAAKELVDVAVKELSGRTITPAILSEVADRSVKTVIKDRGIDILQEGFTGAVQQGIEEGVKAGYDKATGDNTFKTKDAEGNYDFVGAGKRIFDSAFGEAFGAGFVNTISGSKDLILKKGKITESAYDQAVKVGKDAASREYFRKMLETSVKNGVITQDEADNVKKNINAIIEADKLIPSSIKKVEKRVAAVELLREKNSLEAQIEGKDKSLTVKQQERIKAIDSELQDIAMGRPSPTVESKKEEKPISQPTATDPKADIERRRQEDINKNTQNINTADVRRPNGGIGTQGFDPSQMKDLVSFLNDKLGLNIPKNLLDKNNDSLKPLIDFIKDNNLTNKIIDYVKSNPSETITLPDGTIEFKDGNHRANLLNILGSEILPTIDQSLLKEINAKYDAELDALEEKQSSVEPEEITALRKAKELVPLTPEEQAKLDEYDSKNKPGVSSEVGGGETSIQTEPLKKEGEGSTQASGVVQAQEKVQPVKDGNKLFSEPDERIAAITDNYKKSKGIGYSAGEKITQLDEGRSKRIADAFDEMKHDPNNPEVREAYEAMASETMEQHKLLSDNGYVFEIYEGEGEPYKNSQEMLKDLRENKHLYILSTEKDFGQQKITDQQRAENPLLRDSGVKDVNGKPLLVNDLFRGVHDAIGHGERGNSFGAKGEENAWDVHSRMYSPKARRAMTTETRGQNSWVNFGKHLRNPDGSIRKVPAKEKPFAEQKMGLLPEWASEPYESAPQQQAPDSDAKAKFIESKKQELREDEDADYNESLDPFYDKYFGELYDFAYGEGISAEESAVREKILGEVDRVKSALSSVAPGVKIVSHGTTDSFRQALKDAGSTDEEVQQTRLGGGFYDPNTNEIHLNLPEVRSNTLLHEGVHPVLNAIEAINPDAINKLYNQVVEVENRQGLVDERTGEKKYSENFAGRYFDKADAKREKLKPGEKTRVQKMEAVTEFLADVADGTVEINQSNFDKVKQFFVDLMAAIGIDVSGKIKTVGDLKKLADKISNSFKTGEVISGMPLLSSPVSVNKVQQSKAPKVVVKEGGHKLSFVSEKDLFDISSLIDEIKSKGQKVWFWTADQLGRGAYFDTVINGEHYLDAGASYALDPENRSKRIVWATGKSNKWIESKIEESDYIFIISGSPTKSKLFNKQVFDLFAKRVGDFSKFKKEVLKVSKVSDLNSLLSEFSSFDELKNSPKRKDLLIAIDGQKGKKTPLVDVLNKYNAFVDFNDLRDGFYADNGFEMNDIMLVLKPEKFGGESKHSTYENDIIGDVVGVPDRRVNAFDIIPSEYKEGKKITGEAQRSQVVAPYGVGVKKLQAQKPVKGDLIANSPKSKFMTEDGEGNYVFYHYSSSDLSKKGIDPNKTGKNIITSKSEKLLAPASFYYTEPNIQEPGTGEYAHVVRVPKDKVYPYNEDPLNFAEEAERRFREKYPNQAFDANKELAWVSVVAAENGYDVTVANWDGLAGFKQTLRAQSPVKLKPEIWKKPKSGYYNAFDVNDDLEFKSNRRKPLRQQPDQEITPEELKTVLDLLKTRFAGNEKALTKGLVSTDKGKDLLARGILQEVAKKTGSKPGASNKSRVEAVNKRLIESENIPEELRAKIQAEGTISEVFSNEEAKQIADGYINELGVDEAVKLADEGYLKGSVKMFVYGAAIDNITQQINEAKTQEEKDALADKGADIAASLQADAEQYGRFIQAIGTYYKQSPLIIAKREVNRLNKASQDAFNRMVDKKDKVSRTNQGLNYIRKKNVDPEAIKKIKTPKNEKEKTSELNKLRDLWSSLKAKGARQLSDYSDEQIDVLHRMAVIFYADGKQSFASLYKALKEETGISKSDFNELINSKLPSDISPDGMSIVDLANEVNKPLVERVSKEKVEKSDIEKILDSGNRKKAEKSQNVPQKLYAIYGDLNKENRKKMYEDIKNNPDKSEDQLLAEWSSVLNEQQQQAIIDKHFPEKPTENKEKRKAEHEKIIDAYNSGIVNNKGGDKFKELFFDKFGLPKTNTEAMLNYIDQISQKLAKAPEGSIMWRETYEDLLDYIADNTYKNAIASGMDKLSAMWYANILSSPATHLRNLQYNAAQALILNPLMIFEKALLKGDLGQLANINKGMIEGLKKGAIETGRVFRTGRGTRFDGIMERSLADRKLKLWSPVGRALRGSDIFFSDTAYQLKLREFARAMVKEEHPGWNNDEVNAKVNDLMGQTKERKEFASKQAEQELNAFYGENKPKDYETIKKIREFEIIEQTMPDNLKNKLEESKNWAKKSLLTNRPTGLFGVVSDLVGTLNKKLYVTRFIIPFINVPLNVAQAMIERSPFGLIKAASTNTLHSMSDKFEYLNPDQKRELTLKAINYTVGMALLAMINGDDDDDELVITGNNTGEYMDDQGIVHAGGLEPMSVYVDGKKVMSYKTSPFASLLLPAGLMRDAKLYGETKNTTDAISNAFINYIMFINDASAMQGLQGFFGAVADKKLDRAESVRKWFGKQANALTPYSGAVKFITNTVNAAQGEADTRPIELYEYVVKDLPFVQDLVGVSTRRDHFGEPVKEKFDIPLVPVGHRGLIKEISDISPYYKLMNEKDYLQHLKFPTKRTFMVGGKEVEISKKELDQLNTRRGEIVRKALNSKNVFKSRLKEDSARRDMTTIEYLKTLDNELFKERMDQLFDEAGNIARIEKFGEQYGVTKSNLKDHLLELEKARSPKSKKEKSVPAKARVNRKTLKDFEEKNIEIVIESL